MSIDYRLHVFHSPQFESVVHEAIEFFNETPAHELPFGDSFVGSGVYALYYLGGFELYAKISSENQETPQQPIYVGKAVPAGWRTARSKETDAPVLFRRLQEHTRSIRQATNLKEPQRDFKGGNKMKRFAISLILLLLTSLACGPGAPTLPPAQESVVTLPPPAPTAPAPTAAAPTDTPAAEGNAAPTLATCRAWLQEQHSLDYPNHGCEEHADVLNSVAGDGAAAIPLGDDRFFIARFPDDWEQQAGRTLIVALHGSGGCTERMYHWWSKPAAEQGYALLTLQYAQADAAAEEGYTFDDDAQIYERLHSAFDQLAAHCPLDDTKIIYHGFSRGSARSFGIALLDRAAGGLGLFDAFISDSGTGFAETGGEMPDYLQTAAADAYRGARFWLYCGGQDHEGMTCEGMKRMGPLLEERGAEVATYRYAPGGHGLFATVKPGKAPSPALEALLAYIESLAEQ